MQAPNTVQINGQTFRSDSLRGPAMPVPSQEPDDTGNLSCPARRRNRRSRGFEATIKRVIAAQPEAPAGPNLAAWLAIVEAAIERLKLSVKHAETSHKRIRRAQREEYKAKGLHRLCGGCAAALGFTGFSPREAFTVMDASGKVHLVTLNSGEAKSRAQSLAKREGADMILLTAPAYIGTQKQSTAGELIRKTA